MDDIKKTQQENKKKRNKLIIENQGLVKKIAYRYINSGVEIEDLIEEGNLGLIKAIEKFDPTKGYKFSTYAVWWIKRKIQMYINSQTIHLSASTKVKDELLKYRITKNLLIQTLKREPTIEEIAEKSQIPKKQLELIITLDCDMISLDAPIYLDDTKNFEEICDNRQLNPMELYEQKELTKEIKKIIYNANLTEREIDIITMKYGLDGNECKSLEEIAKILGVTRQRIKQIELKILKKIRESNLLDNIEVFASSSNTYKK